MPNQVFLSTCRSNFTVMVTRSKKLLKAVRSDFEAATFIEKANT